MSREVDRRSTSRSDDRQPGDARHRGCAGGGGELRRPRPQPRTGGEGRARLRRRATAGVLTGSERAEGVERGLRRPPATAVQGHPRLRCSAHDAVPPGRRDRGVCSTAGSRPGSSPNPSAATPSPASGVRSPASAWGPGLDPTAPFLSGIVADFTLPPRDRAARRVIRRGRRPSPAVLLR